ncbi:MAG: tetratricopeptide repeat protein, partial [Limisphaerales bacterium]
FDAGATETGRPYFVMELVRGIKITDYCDQNSLSTTERLELFIQVCQAIQHAHQKGIIHRDIKPSNILVTQHDDVAVPKVIDFGIAKATTGQLTDKTVFTAFAQFIGTPAYMSPEQAQMSGLDIDTRADIYSLGVLLYELLTGNPPFDGTKLIAAGLDEMRRKIREDEPPRPSTCLSTMQAIDLTAVAKNRQEEVPKLIHLIRGDLDWLVMKCLEKDRTRRYETASALATDLQRHLNNEPVMACPPSNLYRFQKLVRRNKLAFAAVAAITTALVLGVVVSSWQALRATRAEQAQIKLRKEAEAEKKKAQIEAAKSEQVARFLKDMLETVQPSVALGRDTTMLREILDKTAERVGKDLKDQPEVEAELRSILGVTYLAFAEWGKAETMHREALRLRISVFGETNELVGASLNNLARALVNLDKKIEAENTARQALTILRKLHGDEHADIAFSLYLLASSLHRQSKMEEAKTIYLEALAMRRKLLGDHLDVASTLNNLAVLLHNTGDNTSAEPAIREAVDMQRRLVGNEHPGLATSLRFLSDILRGLGKFPEAVTAARESLAIRQKIFGSNNWYTIDSAKTLIFLQGHDKPLEAEKFFRETWHE